MTDIRIGFARVGNARPLYAVNGAGFPTAATALDYLHALYPSVTKGAIRAVLSLARQCGASRLEVPE